MEKIDFIILYTVIMICFGVSSSVFYPDQYALGDDDFVDIQPDDVSIEQDPPWWQGILDAFGLAMNFFKFLWACISFNIPFCPIIVRLILTVPLHLAMGYTIFCLVRGGG